MLPLYPQYCSSTTGSAFDRTAAVLRRWRWLPETRFVNDYYADAGYLDALTARIAGHWTQLGERTHLLFSYHGIPASYVQRGRPLPRSGRGDHPRGGLAPGTGADQWTHCYQSRFGSVRMAAALHRGHVEGLAKRGVRKLTVVSPSFAVDCLETLEEVAIEYRDKFRELGGEQLNLVPALNDDPRHVEALAANHPPPSVRMDIDSRNIIDNER